MKHRNTIETWSKTTQTFTGNMLNYDFTTAASKAFGDNMMQADTSPVEYALYGGDVNQDDAVDLTDVLQTYNDANTFTTGYAVTDLNGDSQTDLTDVILAYNNSAGFVAAVKP